MKTPDVRTWTVSALIVVLAIPLTLWSWNTIAELLGLPTAQARHAIAACLSLFALRWLLFPGRSRSHGHFGNHHAE